MGEKRKRGQHTSPMAWSLFSCLHRPGLKPESWDSIQDSRESEIDPDLYHHCSWYTWLRDRKKPSPNYSHCYTGCACCKLRQTPTLQLCDTCLEVKFLDAIIITVLMSGGA